MSGTTSPQETIPPTHQNFRWIDGPGQQEPLADFVELAHDIAAGVNTCLQVIFASDLAREQNEDAEPECVSAPAISKTDAANLFRFSIAATGVLLAVSRDKIDGLNTYWEK